MKTLTKTLAAAAIAAFTFGLTPSAQAEDVAQVTIGGVTTPYATIEAAWEAACASTETPTVLTLLKDIALTDTLITTGSANFTFDLNGKTLSAGGDFSGRLIYQFSGSEQTIKNGTITGAKSTAVHCENAQKMTLDHVVLTGNSSENGGAVFCNHNTRLLMKDCVVTNNVATGSGGGIYKVGFQATTTAREDKMVLVRTVIRHNRATNGNGGGVYFMSTQCLAAGTMIRMADGTEKAIENVAEGDCVATFDHEGGTNASARVFLATKGKTKELPFTLTFDNGVTLSIAGRHDLLEQTSLKYVTIDEANAAGYVGKSFYGADGQWHELTGVQQATEKSDYYSIYTAQHFNSYANGMLTVADDVDYLLNIYELDGKLKADATQLAADIAQYGLADFDETAAQYGISRAWFDDAGTKYYPVAIGKGLATLEGLEALFASTQANDDPTIESATEGVLTLGEGVIVTDNTAQGKKSNIYLVPYADDWPAYIALADSHSGICAGVTTVKSPTTVDDVQFMGYGATAADTALFTSDEGYSVIYKESALFLSVNPPPVEYVAPVYKSEGDPKSGIDHWVTNSVSEYTVVSDQTEWGAAGETNWYVVASDVTIADRITCLGDVRLILKDGATLTASSGITASTATEDYFGFTVYAQSEGETMGALVAADNVPKRYAGIGGWYGSDQNKGFSGSNITINGGTVTAKGGENADGDSGAGIGGGASGIGSNIVVNGGTVAATGGQYSAGIGGGQETGGSDITINGGTVTAVGGGRSAGIGGGYGNTGSGITINGGTVTAVGDCGAAAIGGGLVSVGSDISIANATLYLASPALNYEDELVSADVIGSGFASEESSSGVTIDASAKVFFNLTGVQNLDGSWIEPISPMPASFEGFAIMTPETAVERVLVGGIANWTAGKTFNLVNAATAATGTITVKDEKGTVFANKLLKLPHADSTLTLTAEDPPTPTGIQVGDSVYAVLDETGKICTLTGTGETWDFKVCTNELAQVTNVVIGAGVTHIGSRFFKKAYNLQAVSGGADLASVGTNAFYLCTRLETIHLDCTAAPAGMADAVVVRTAIKPDGSTYVIPDVKPGYKHVLFGKKSLDDADWTDLGSPEGKTIYDYDGYRFFQLKLVEEL